MTSFEERVLSPVAVLLGMAVAAFSSSAAAQSGGYYFEIAAGSTESSVEPLLSITSRSQVSKSTQRSSSYSLIGGWRFNDNLSVEVNYTDHGRFSDRASLSDRFIVVERDHATNGDIENLVDARLDADVDYELQSYGVSMLANWPVSRRWNVYARLGLMSWEAESSVKGRMTYRGDLNRDWDIRGKLSDSGSSFSYGLGVFYRFTRSYAATLEYQHMRMETDVFSNDPRLDSLNFGLRYYF